MLSLVFIGMRLERFKIAHIISRIEVALLTIVFMWAVIDSFRSRVAPRYFAICDQEMCWSLMLKSRKLKL